MYEKLTRIGRWQWCALAGLLGALAGVGCSCADEPDTPAVDDVPLRIVAYWGTARDVELTMWILEHLALWPEGTACPSVRVEGDTTFVEGGCTSEENGAEYTGSAVLVGSLDDDFTMTWTEFGVLGFSTCLEAPESGQFHIDGIVDGRMVRAGVQALYVEVRAGRVTFGPECEPNVLEVSWNYTLTITDRPDGDGGWADELLEGSGLVSATFQGIRAEALADTTDQLMSNDDCGFEPLTGTTTFHSEIGDAVLVNDGASDCDESATGLWMFEDRDAVEIPIGGVVCAVRRVGGADPPAGLAVVALAVVLAAAQRRRRPYAAADDHRG